MTDGHLMVGDGIRLYFDRRGTGPIVIVPNGLYLADDFERLTRAHTLVYYDVRNRGRSDAVNAPARLKRGVLNDVDDLEAVRRHFALERLDLVAHSYVAVIAALYARTHPHRVSRIVQIGPMQPHAAKQYSSRLPATDTTLADTLAKLTELRTHPPTDDPQELCEHFWTILSRIYVTNPADAHRVRWGRCELPNERNFMKYWMGTLLPSIQAVSFTPDQFSRVTAPMLTIHGTHDRSAPHEGGRDWARLLPNARLLTVEGAGHAPWIESPDLVLAAIDTFLRGAWPPAATKV